MSQTLTNLASVAAAAAAAGAAGESRPEQNSPTHLQQHQTGFLHLSVALLHCRCSSRMRVTVTLSSGAAVAADSWASVVAVVAPRMTAWTGCD